MKSPIPRKRDTRKYSSYKSHRYETLKELISSSMDSGLHTLHLNNRYFDFIFEKKGSKTLFISFSAAAGADKTSYPIFSAKKLGQSASVDWLAFADAAQAAPEGLKTSWHLGTQRMPTSKMIVSLIKTLKMKFGYENLILFGSSAGGYAALNIGRQIPDATIVVINPRTELETQPTTFAEFLAIGRGGKDEFSDIDKSMPLAYSYPNGSRIVYIQNKQDKYYYTSHYKPFMENNVNELVTITGDWGVGHVVPPEWVYSSVLHTLFRGRSSVDEYFSVETQRVPYQTRTSNNSNLASHLIGSTTAPRSDDLLVANRLLQDKIVIASRPDVGVSNSIDWSMDPYKDNNWRFVFHSLSWIDPLRRAFLKTGKVEYLEKFRQIILSWHRFHILSGRHTPYSWYDMATGIRVKIIAAAIHTIGTEEWLELLFYKHALYLSDDKFQDRKGNHTLHAMIGLLISAGYFSRDDWISRAVSKITSLFDECVDDEGVDYEGALQYQINNFRWYSEASKHIKLVTGDLPSFRQKLQMMPEFLAHATNTSGFYVQYGESDRMPASNSLNSPQLEWAGSRGVTGDSPDDVYRSYGAGYTFGRSGWSPQDFADGIHYSLRHGASYSETPHGQRDSGAITLSRGNAEYLFESGRYRYDNSAESLYLNSPAAHSTIIEGNTEECDATNTNLINSHTQEQMDWTVISKVLPNSSIWVRSVLHLRNEKSLLIIDDLTGLNNELFTQHWQLANDSVVSSDGERLSIASPSREHVLNFDILSSGACNISTAFGESDPLLGWRSTKHGEIFPAHLLKVEHFGRSTRVATLVSFNDVKKIALSDTNSSVSLPLSPRCKSNFVLTTDSTSIFVEVPSADDFSTKIPNIRIESL